MTIARSPAPASRLSTMRAVFFDRCGGPDVLRVGELPCPVAGPGQLLIDVAFAGVNAADWKVREGWLAPYFTYDFPFVNGFDAAGIVAAVGEGVAGFVPGDRVVAATDQGVGGRGAYAECVAVAVARTVRLPGNVSLAAAATIPTPGATAWQAVRGVGQVQPGMRVLVHGGAGATGSFALQLARADGAQVAATCGPANLDYVRRLGANLAIDYRQGRIAETLAAWAPDGVDLIVDAVGKGSLPDPVALVRPGGLIAAIATLDPTEPAFDTARAEAKGVRHIVTFASHADKQRQMQGLVDLMAAGTIVAPDIETLPLDAAAEAQRRVQDGHVRGKLLLAIEEG